MLYKYVVRSTHSSARRLPKKASPACLIDSKLMVAVNLSTHEKSFTWYVSTLPKAKSFWLCQCTSRMEPPSLKSDRVRAQGSWKLTPVILANNTTILCSSYNATNYDSIYSQLYTVRRLASWGHWCVTMHDVWLKNEASSGDLSGQWLIHWALRLYRRRQYDWLNARSI